MFKKLTYIRES